VAPEFVGRCANETLRPERPPCAWGLANASASLAGNGNAVLQISPGLPVCGLPWENAPRPQPQRGLWRDKVDDAVKLSTRRHAQARLATTSFGVEGALPKTPGSPQTGNLGLICRTALPFPARRLAEELAKPQTGLKLAGSPALCAGGLSAREDAVCWPF